MGIFNFVFGKKYDPYNNCDWDVYYKDYENGMPYEEIQRKFVMGEYEKGVAKVSTDYGRIDDINAYNKDVKEFGKGIAENFRKKGCYMNR